MSWRWLVLAACLLAPPTLAHDANLTTVLIREAEQGWTLQVLFSPDVALQAVGVAEPEAVDRAELQERIVAHIRHTLQLEANGTPVQLGAGGIRLADHQSDVLLALDGMPPQLRRLDAHITTFAASEQHHTVVRLFRGEQIGRVVLSARNGYRGTVWAAEGQPWGQWAALLMVTLLAAGGMVAARPVTAGRGRTPT